MNILLALFSMSFYLSGCTSQGSASSVTSEKVLGPVVAVERTFQIDLKACESAWNESGCTLRVLPQKPYGELNDSNNYRSYTTKDGAHRVNVKGQGGGYFISIQRIGTGTAPTSYVSYSFTQANPIIQEMLDADPSNRIVHSVSFEVQTKP